MLKQYLNHIPDYAKDIKLNLTNVTSQTPSSQLNSQQIAAILLASAYATKNEAVISTTTHYANDQLDEATISAAKAAASIMAMNNIYYRFIHMMDDNDMTQLPANLRMNIIANPGIDKKDFELLSLAVSAINGCGMCVKAHSRMLLKEGLSKVTLQHAIRIAAVVNSLAQVMTIEQHSEAVATL